MNPRLIAFLKLFVLLTVIVGLVLLFPAALKFVELAARELRYLWWLVLLLALAAWLIWGLGKKKK
ncbi:MAG: hypothetical protein WCS42_07095 [Verrucomicrobiota bacterium]